MARGEVKYRLTLDAKEFQSGIKVATKDFEGFITQLGAGTGSVGKMAQAMGPAGMAVAAGIGVATAAVAGFVKITLDAAMAAVAFAGKISDLATKTGISGEALQKLGYAGSLVGTSMEDMGKAVAKMQQHMVNAPEDFRQLGLSLDELRKLAPEKQFEAVGRAIQSIQDPAQKTAATIAFMGKGGQEAMKALSVDLEKAAEKAERLGLVMKDSTRLALDDLGDSVTTLSSTWDHLLMNWGGAIAETPEVREAVEAITEALGDMSVFVQKNADEIQDLIRVAVIPMADAAVTLIKAVEYIIRGFVALIQKVKELKAELGGGWLERGLAWVNGGDGFGGGSGGGGNRLSATSRAGKPPGWIDPAELKKSEQALKKYLDQIDKDMEEYRKNYEKTEEAILQFQIRTHQLATKESEKFWNEQINQAERYGKELLAEITARKAAEKAIAQAWEEEQRRIHLQALADVRALADAFAMLGEEIGGVAGAVVTFGGDMLNALANMNDETIRSASLWQKLAGAIQGAVAAYRAGEKAGSAGKGALAGAGKGAAVGAAFGPYGMVIGAVAGGIIGAIGGADARRKELAKLNEELIALQRQAAAAGIILRQTFNTKDPESYRRAIQQVEEALDMNRQANEALNEAIERYGFTIDELGPRFAQQRMDEMALQLLQDFRLLTASGIEIDTVLGRMGGSINEFIQMAISSGTSVPEAMRPMLQAMIDAGLLLDENGVAFENLEDTGVTFAQSMSEQFATLIDRIDALVNALLGIPNVTRTVTVVTTHQGGGGEDEDENRRRGYAHGGYIPATPGGRSIRVAEGGEGEYVIPESRMGAMGGDVIVYIGGEKLDGVITRRVRSGNIRVS